MRVAFLAALCWLTALLVSAALHAADSEGKPQRQGLSTYVSVAGAPGDGEQALAAALGKRLAVLGVKQATAFEANVYDVQGTVRVSPAPKAKRRITIIWVVLAPDGNQLGVTRQTKEVKKGSSRQEMGRRRRRRGGSSRRRHRPAPPTLVW